MYNQFKVFMPVKGYVTKLHFEDWLKVKDKAWRVNAKGNKKYVLSQIWYGRNRRPKMKTIFLHDIVANNNFEKGLEVDHIDGDSLNNLKSNLRLVTRQQNNMNRGPRPNSISKYKGVTFNKKQKRWVARIGVDGKTYHIAQSKNEDEMALAYNEEAKKIFGKYAFLNEVNDVFRKE